MSNEKKAHLFCIFVNGAIAIYAGIQVWVALDYIWVLIIAINVLAVVANILELIRVYKRTIL